ncbi:MAG: nicotinate-nucleotide adenylyltransferase [Demequinaceae bacterium]|nr:nicotinate-nucleotide adenylyltransferase [Demequinaceae bacterium]
MVESPKRIGVLGGTFDPIHLGHLAAAGEVAGVLSLDRVFVVPTAGHPLKDGSEEASAEDRLAMASLAVSGDPLLQVSRVDVDRGIPTHTIDTLTDLGAETPGAEWFFITGADALARLDEWQEASRLRDLATFVGVTRPGYEWSGPIEGVTLVEVPGFDLSSTDVRRRVRTGQPFRYLVPGSVADYIEEHHLYRGGSDG